MTQTDIQFIEMSIGKKMPDVYTQLLLNYPPFLINAGAPANTVSELTLMNSVDSIIQENMDLLAAEPPVPQEYIVIGIDGCGNYYFLNIIDEKVYFLDHESPKFIDEECTIFDFVNTLSLENNSVVEYADELIKMWSQE